jgi:hypothetical protein
MTVPVPSLAGMASALTSPVYALPVDIFRVLAGLVGFTYFARIFYDAPDLSSPDGLIDHRLCRRIFPPTRLSFFYPGIPARLFRPVFLLACVASLCVVAGFHARSAAALLFVVAVSTYRWNLFAVYVDDAIVHLLFFWLVLLPVGTTLQLPGLLREGPAVFDSWMTTTVPGASVRAFLANMALVYVAAGIYKFTSPMWRNGSALHAILKMPIARAPELWRAKHHTLLRLGNYWGLIMEPLLAFMFVLPANSVFKWFFVASAAAFHVGIILTLKIPFANLAMLGAIPLALSPEMMQGLMGQPTLTGGTVSPSLLPTDLVALGLVVTLTLMILWEALRSWKLNNLPLWKTHMSGFLGNPMYVVLWLVGIAQSYRLFDWIDTRNYHVRYEVFLTSRRGPGRTRLVDPREMFPRSLRHLLLQSYLIGNVWLQIDADQLAEVRRSLLQRHAQRFARRYPEDCSVEVFVITQRVTTENLSLTRGERRLLMRFECRGGRALLESSRDMTAEPERDEAEEAVCAAS